MLINKLMSYNSNQDKFLKDGLIILWNIKPLRPLDYD